MFKINMILYLYVATSLVAGEWQPQNYGQHQFRYSLPPPPPPPPPQFDQKQAQPTGVPEQPPRFPQARPCRRQNNGDIGAMLTDSGWVPLPFNKPPNPARDQQTRNQVEPQFQPQSLTENRAPAVDDQKQEARQHPASKFPDKIVEYVEKNSVPNQMSPNLYTDDNENERAADQVLNDNSFETANVDRDAAAQLVRSGYPDQAGLERVDSHEISHECDRHVHPHQDLRHDNSETQDAVKSAPKEAQEQTVKTLSDCVQGSRRSMHDLEDDSRRSDTTSLILSSEHDKTEAAISSKTESNDNSRSNLMKSARMPNNNKIKPYLQNPAKNAGNWQSDTHVSLMENGRVCYACSTYYDPSCWSTNATTTVKYCNKDNNACVSKMYKIDGKVILIRDCGHTCNVREEYQIGQKMTSCSMCHGDLCNGACTLTSLSALLATLIIALKFT